MVDDDVSLAEKHGHLVPLSNLGAPCEERPARSLALQDNILQPGKCPQAGNDMLVPSSSKRSREPEDVPSKTRRCLEGSREHHGDEGPARTSAGCEPGIEDQKKQALVALKGGDGPARTSAGCEPGIGGQKKQALVAASLAGPRGVYGEHAGLFLAARQEEMKEDKMGTEGQEPVGESHGKKAPKKAFKRPSASSKSHAASLKRPAAKQKEQPRECGELKELRNTSFHAKGYGQCKVEYYSSKSYIRQLKDCKWVMIVGSTHTKHKQVCMMLLPHVKKGCSREELLAARQKIVDQLE